MFRGTVFTVIADTGIVNYPVLVNLSMYLRKYIMLEMVKSGEYNSLDYHRTLYYFTLDTRLEKYLSRQRIQQLRDIIIPKHTSAYWSSDKSHRERAEKLAIRLLTCI